MLVFFTAVNQGFADQALNHCLMKAPQLRHEQSPNSPHIHPANATAPCYADFINKRKKDDAYVD
ncbi:hypothetical protein TK35_01980 [Lacticaseibacillus paracasei]|nr:hypothetical protein TK35_01980 [Lacticaseibacillus paracasei]TEA94439.1 hypothetical protein TK36_01715 [Lacticaseibacillus paracasei]